MTIGLVGRKCGMTRVFNDAGVAVPVTVIEALPNRVSQIKTVKNDGYSAVQVTVGSRKASRVTKPLAGHFAKANVAAGSTSGEFRLGKGDGENLAAGAELKVDIFSAGQIVDVTGTTVGKGFAGTMKRHNFKGGRKTHGNSLSHRSPGSIGQRQTPGRVFKGKRMSGHMGVRDRTIENLKVVQIDVARNLLLISGAVPGAEGGRVVIRPSVKAVGQARRNKLTPNKVAPAAPGAKPAASKSDKK
jgi:large subunit ribosomal protein L3